MEVVIDARSTNPIPRRTPSNGPGNRISSDSKPSATRPSRVSPWTRAAVRRDPEFALWQDNMTKRRAPAALGAGLERRPGRSAAPPRETPYRIRLPDKWCPDSTAPCRRPGPSVAPRAVRKSRSVRQSLVFATQRPPRHGNDARVLGQLEQAFQNPRAHHAARTRQPGNFPCVISHASELNIPVGLAYAI